MPRRHTGSITQLLNRDINILSYSDAIEQTAPYRGFPQALNALAIAETVLVDPEGTAAGVVVYSIENNLPRTDLRYSVGDWAIWTRNNVEK